MLKILRSYRDDGIKKFVSFFTSAVMAFALQEVGGHWRIRIYGSQTPPAPLYTELEVPAGVEDPHRYLCEQLRKLGWYLLNEVE